jgi:omega-amidase
MSTRVASVQLPFQYFNTPQEFADYVRAPIELAAENGAQLVLLPHLTSTMLFGMFDFDAQPTQPLEELAQRQNVSMQAWLEQRTGYVFEFYLHLFQSLASRVETWLAPGTVFEQDEEALYLTAFLFNPEGETVGRQRQMHRSKLDIERGIAQGDTARVFETEIGDFGFVIGEDVRYPEVARALALNGANVLLHPAAYHEMSSNPQEQFLTDIWRDVQSNQTFGVQANLVGNRLHGRSAIYAPVELTEDKRGIYAQATQDTEGEVLLAELDFIALKKLQAEYPILELRNPTLYRGLESNPE